MSIDIDSFLSKYTDEPEHKKKKKKVEEKIDLSFQKDVEEKLQDYEKQGLSKDFQFLKKVYDEIKGFDEDLPNKFLGIEGKGDLALKNLGSKYSKEFLVKVKKNGEILTTQITQELNQLDSAMQAMQFGKTIQLFDSILQKYSMFPKEILVSKSQIYEQIKSREIKINEFLQDFKKTQLVQIRTTLKQKAADLAKSMTPSNIEEIESNIEELHSIIAKTPKVFLSDLTEEKIKISSLLIKAQQYLTQEYKVEFESRKQIISQLTEKFHSYYLKNDLDNVILTYDEIIYQFEKLPNVLLELKISEYEKINELYASINSLIVKNSVSTFLESYNSSKIIEEAKDYIRHIKEGGKINETNLEEIRSKLELIPQKYSMEKRDIEKEIQTLRLPNYHKEETQPSQTPNEPQVKVEDIPQGKNTNKKLIDEINMLFEKMKQSNNPAELKTLYKKIFFYIDTLPVDKEKKTILKNTVNKTLHSKKLA